MAIPAEHVEYMKGLKGWLDSQEDTPLEEMGSFFGARIGDYEEHMLEHWAFGYEYLAKLVPENAKHVLDLGCGTGLSTDAWKGNCGKVIGIEPSGDMLAVAREKSGHLANIRNSGHFRYVRELVFANAAPYTTQRFIGLAQSQGSLQTLLKLHPELIESDWKRFQERISECFGEPRIVEFCYRVRLGVK